MFKKLRKFLFINSTTGQTIAKNTFWLFFGQIASRLIRMAIVIYGARILGVAEWGAFSYALGLAAFFTTFVDFGINAVITRESLEDIKQQERYFGTALLIKIMLLMGIAIVLLVGAPYFIDYFTQEADTAQVLALLPYVIFIMAFDGLRDFGATLSRAWEKMEIESGIQIITNIIIVGASFLALAISKTAESLAIGYAIGTGIGMICAFIPFRTYFKNIRSKISKDLIRPILAASWPIGMLGLIGTINLNTDLVMLGWYRNLETVGYYSSAQKIAQLVQSIPGLIAVAFFPSLVKNINTEKFKYLIEKATRILLILAIPITAITVIYAGAIIHILFGEQYLPAQRTLQVMNFTYITAFLGAIMGNALFAIKQERKLMVYSVVGIVSNIVLNTLFIPLFGASGAALSTVITSILVILYLYVVLNKKVRFSLTKNLRNITLAAIAMIGIMLIFRGKHDIALGIIGTILGSGAYIFVLWKLKEENLFEIIRAVKGFFSREKETV